MTRVICPSKQLPTTLYSLRDELTVQDGLIVRGQRVVIPASLQKQMKNKLHSLHMGKESCLRRVREFIFWLRMPAKNNDKATSRSMQNLLHIWNEPAKETLMPHKVPSRPWKKVGTDLFEFKNKSYLITVDYYSNFWEVDKLPDTKARTVILKLKNHQIQMPRQSCVW